MGTGSLSAPDVNSTDNKGRMDPGRDSTAGFFSGLIVVTSGALSDLVFIDAVVQHWLLANDCDCIAVGLLFESPSMQ